MISLLLTCFVLHCPDYNPGLFSQFNTVLGFLEFYEQGHDSIHVDFGKKGIYYEKKWGENWWEYYFEPIAFGKCKKENAISDRQCAAFASRAGEMGCEEAHGLIQKYIRIKPPIQAKIDAFEKDHFAGHFVVGIHFRGTDKSTEARRVCYEEVYREIEKFSAEAILFVATDEQPFLDEIKKRYPGRVCYADAIRSSNDVPVHSTRKNGYLKGEQAVIDCLLLSRTDFLIRTNSNLSLCSTYFNPELPSILLNPN